MNSRWDAPSVDHEPLRETSTHWSLIRQAQHPDTEVARTALHQLTLRYAPPLLNYLQGAPWGFDTHAAQDLMQGFVEARMLAGRLVAQSDPSRGHFRSYLKTALDNFVRDRLRSPGQTPRSLARGTVADDGPVIEFAGPMTTFDPFDIAWARGILHAVVSQLKQYCAEHGQAAVWTIFEARLLRPILQQAAPRSYEELAVQCGLDSAKAAANSLITAKRIFRKLFEDAIATYAPDAGEREEELHLIRSVFASGVSWTESPAPDPSLDDSCRLARMLDLPRAQPLWSPLELEAIIDQYLTLPITDFGLHATSSLSELTLWDVLTTGRASSSDCMWVKDWTKSQAISSAPVFPREVAGALYFAAIAKARVAHQARITQLPDRILAVSLSELAEHLWIPVELRNLYRTGREALTSI